MALTEKITCDICGIQKGEANHWMLWIMESPNENNQVGGIRLAPWHKEWYRDYGHLCGESCASKLLSKAIADWYPKVVEKQEVE